MIKLTEMERKVLEVLFESSEGSGHDFGFIEDARGVVGKAQLGGVVASLAQKGIIEVYEPVRTDSGLWTQFSWRDRIEGTPNPNPVCDLLGKPRVMAEGPSKEVA